MDHLERSWRYPPCPPLLDDYVKYMRGVDRGDQLITLYNGGRRSKKWWRRVFFYLLEVAILNSYIIEGFFRSDHQSRGSKKKDLVAFRFELAEQLIGLYRGRKRPGRHRSHEMDRLKPELSHLPVAVTPHDCVVCSTKGRKQHLSRFEYRHKTNFVCSHCNVALCITKDRDCFRNYHTYAQYWLH